MIEKYKIPDVYLKIPKRMKVANSPLIEVVKLSELKEEIDNLLGKEFTSKDLEWEEKRIREGSKSTWDFLIMIQDRLKNNLGIMNERRNDKK